MNEAEWRRGADPAPLLKVVQSTQSRRKVGLFSCACCRRLWDFLPEDSREAVEIAERFADDRASRLELDKAHARAGAAVLSLPRVWSYDVLQLRYATAAAAECCLRAAVTIPGAIAIALTVVNAVELAAAVAVPAVEFAHARVNTRAAELEAQADLVREIFDSPLRLPRFDPAWRTDTAVAIARQMYALRDFSGMPILADALQDAGCESEAVLNHCRGDVCLGWSPAGSPEPICHVRGCWVIDLVLGKS
jgi:hypothetical protein